MPTRANAEVNYLDPVVLSTLGSFELVARMVVEGFISGLHRSPYRGYNVEFSEHRSYSPGDEIRHIDWRAYAKVDRFLVKQFEEETNLRGYLVLDCSESMEYTGKGRLSKSDYAKVLCASLAYLMLRQRDGVGLLTFADRVQSYIPPRGKTSHLEAVIDGLTQHKPQGETSFDSVLSEVAEQLNRRGLVILISDLIDEPVSVLRGLQLLKHRKHDLIIFHVLDPDEIELPFRGFYRFEDPETHSALQTDPGRLKEEYSRRMQEFIKTYREGATEIGIDYLLLQTNEPLDRALASYLAGRKRMLSG